MSQQLEVSPRMQKAADAIAGGTSVDEAMRSAGYREGFIEAEASTFVESYLTPKGFKVNSKASKAKETVGVPANAAGAQAAAGTADDAGIKGGTGTK